MAIALSILIGYHHVPVMTLWLDRLADFKQQTGLAFAMVSTTLFGAIIPMLMQQALPQSRQPGAWRLLPYLCVFWAVRGMEFDLFYHAQAWLVGNDSTFTTVLIKVIIDQFVYCPIWAVPSMLLVYALPAVNYDVRRVFEHLGSRWYRRRAIPLLVANWCVWIPAVAVIYNLKLSLQLPIQNLVLCLWAILAMLLLHRPAVAMTPPTK